MKTSDVLRGAADHIEKVGLHKGWYFKGDDETHEYSLASTVLERKDEVADLPCCTMGGVYFAAETVTEASLAEDALHRTLPNYESVPEWNDRPSQRKGKVVAKLRQVADELDEVAA